MNEESPALTSGMRPTLGEPGIHWSGDGGLGGPRPEVIQAAPTPVSASVRLRALGFLIDLTILFGVALIVSIAVVAVAVDTTATQEEVQRDIEDASPYVYAIVGVMQFGYNLLWNVIGWSPGKRMVRLRIIRVDGQAPGLGLGLRRTIGAFLSNSLFGLGYAWAIWDRDHRTWHDRIGRTWVSREADLEGQQRRP